MAHLWMKDEDGVWCVAQLRASAVRLAAGGPVTCEEGAPAEEGALAENRDLRLLRSQAAGGETWSLLAGPHSAVMLNGRPLPAGIAVLQDRDEILCCDLPARLRRMFFSTEVAVCVEPLPSGVAASCPRCKLPLQPGKPAVRCPTCKVWHHQAAAEGGTDCWTYGETCAACRGHATALDAGFRWTPDDL